MWCGACQQDVPGVVASNGQSSICCARCGKPLHRSRWQDGTTGREPNTSCETGKRDCDAHRVPFDDLPEFIELEDWEFEETIQEAERLVRRVTRSPELGLAQIPQQRVDGGHETHRLLSAKNPSRESASSVPVPPKQSSSLPWILLSIGLGVFVCGAALIGLSFVHQRPQLWQLGLPLLLGGQVAVLAVVIWQLDVAWNSHRATFVALHAMDDQLRRLREDWSHLTPGSVPHDHAFYRHLAEGAGPDVLLADLKDQMEVLSAHLARKNQAA